MPSYSREHPSPRYFQLIEQHKQLHMQSKGIGDQCFQGKKMLANILDIKQVIDLTGSRTILDYGSGKGCLYEKNTVLYIKKIGTISLKKFWGIQNVTCFDPCYPAHNILPTGKFDGVICIDVLEHCPEEDLPWIVKEIFSYANFFVYVNVACALASKNFINGENVHVTVRPPDWWHKLFLSVAEDFPEILWELVAIEKEEREDGPYFPGRRYRSQKKIAD